MKYILGKKVRMTQVYDADTSKVVPVTIVKADPCTVVALRTHERHGYTSAQIGAGKAKKLKQSVAGQVKHIGKVQMLKEVRFDTAHGTRELSAGVGEALTVEQFQKGDQVQVQSVSKGKGFQGVVKRWGFKGHPATHGHKDQLRMPGSIGQGGVQRVFRGKRMGGHMGSRTTTIKGLTIAQVHPETGELYVRGAIPGARGTVVEIMQE